jgi:hypothetical protein
MELTPRQQRRLQQKLAIKAAKKAAAHHSTPDQPTTTDQSPAHRSHERSDSCPAAISEAKLLANRSNALLSTGPRTGTGREIVSKNATKHGLTGDFNVLPDESQEDFDQLVAGLTQAEDPADQEEVQYVQFMAEAIWLSRRAVRLQDQAILTIIGHTGGAENGREAVVPLHALYDYA